MISVYITTTYVHFVGLTPAMSFMVNPPALKTIALQGVETSNKNPLNSFVSKKQSDKLKHYKNLCLKKWFQKALLYRQHKCVAGSECDTKGKVDLNTSGDNLKTLYLSNFSKHITYSSEQIRTQIYSVNIIHV